MYENTPGLLFGLSLCCNVDNEGERLYAHELRRGQTTKRASERRDKDVERWRVGAAKRAAEKGVASLAAASMAKQVRLSAFSLATTLANSTGRCRANHVLGLYNINH
jgi:hypothetical protein